ncbi:uncharacterized protein LOC128492809 [Spea bombifrons]|uniref:uncharacterized protein LOC128492809 n=1 Tax=Spea bombifrons TaxID=233779 RepID=UPI00234914E1|nr:uncharacterized protein LOC128492809 [Spea bombifrons]
MRWQEANQEVLVAGVGSTLNDDLLTHTTHLPANGVLVRNEPHLLPNQHIQLCQRLHVATNYQSQHESHVTDIAAQQAHPERSLLQREKVFFRLSLREQQEAMQRLKDLHKEAELKCESDRRRQMLRFQERLSIARNRKSEEDLLGTTPRGSPQLSPEPVSQGDAEHQKSAVREHLERVKRERTYFMQSKRERNTSTFRELLDPVLTRNEQSSGGTRLRGANSM